MWNFSFAKKAIIVSRSRPVISRPKKMKCRVINAEKEPVFFQANSRSKDTRRRVTKTNRDPTLFPDQIQLFPGQRR